MRRRGPLLHVLAFAIVAAAVATIDPPGHAQSARVDDATLRTAWQQGEWVSYGNDPGERRYSPLDQITPANVTRLNLVWSAVAGTGGGNQEATPLAWNGVLYAITNWSIVFALDARTGRELWRYDPGVDRSYTTPGQNRGVCCGVVNRGVALYQDTVLAPVLDGRLVALDARSGTLRWTTRVFPADASGYSITMAPRIAKGRVIVGVAGAEFTPHRGFFSAFDIGSGRELWRFYTVPGDPSKPFENRAMEAAAKTWKGEWWKYGGGGSLWDGLSYDPDADLIYIGTGNGAPWPEILRGSEGADNLYVSSILAVDPDDGELKWHYQAVPGDSWDIDNVQQMILADVEIDGRTRKVLMQASKGGFFYVLDRLTGEFISATPFAPLNWASGHDPKTGRPLINREAYYSATQPVVISPAAGGASNWAAEAYSPATKLVYMPVNGFSSRTYLAVPVEMIPGRAVQQNGTARGGLPPGITATPLTPPYVGPSRELKGGFLVALDPATRRERWRVEGGGGSGGGVLATATDLVFQVVPDGRVRALDARSGAVLWQAETGQRGMGPPITYRVDGRQYIAFMGGSGTGGRGGAAQPPMVYAYALDAGASPKQQP